MSQKQLELTFEEFRIHILLDGQIIDYQIFKEQDKVKDFLKKYEMICDKIILETKFLQLKQATKTIFIRKDLAEA